MEQERARTMLYVCDDNLTYLGHESLQWLVQQRPPDVGQEGRAGPYGEDPCLRFFNFGCLKRLLVVECVRVCVRVDCKGVTKGGGFPFHPPQCFLSTHVCFIHGGHLHIHQQKRHERYVMRALGLGCCNMAAMSPAANTWGWLMDWNVGSMAMKPLGSRASPVFFYSVCVLGRR